MSKINLDGVKPGDWFIINYLEDSVEVFKIKTIDKNILPMPEGFYKDFTLTPEDDKYFLKSKNMKYSMFFDFFQNTIFFNETKIEFARKATFEEVGEILSKLKSHEIHFYEEFKREIVEQRYEQHKSNLY